MDSRRDALQTQRDKLDGALIGLGIGVYDCSGTHFLCVVARPLGSNDSTAFCEKLPHRAQCGDDPGSTPSGGICSASESRPLTRR